MHSTEPDTKPIAEPDTSTDIKPIAEPDTSTDIGADFEICMRYDRREMH